MRGGKAENRPGLPAEAVSKKGRTTPLYFEGLKFARLGFRQSIYDPAGNFYTSDNGEKRCKTKKSGVPSLKNQVKTPLMLIKSLCFAIFWKRHLWKITLDFAL